MSKYFFFLFLFLSLASQSNGQLEEKTQSFFSPRYTLQSPSGDLANRFGINSSLGITFGSKTEKRWYYGGNFNFLFGNKVTQPGILQNLLSEDGEIISSEGRPATVLIQERGFNLSGDFGRFFRFKNSEHESGILLTFGAGFLQHNIRYETQLDEVPQLEGEYEKGYDRLTNGLMISQNVGWMFFSKKRAGDFYIGLELIEGFTQSRRSYNFDTQSSDIGVNRLDVLTGIKIAWIVPFYKRSLYI